MTLTRTTPNYSIVIVRCALAGLIPPASLVAAFLAAFALGSVLQNIGESIGTAIVTLLVFAGLAVGGGLWARVLAHLVGIPHTRRFILAGALSQAAMTVLAIVVLGRLEVALVEEGNSPLPLHNLFMLLFVPATFTCAFMIGSALGLAIGDKRLAIQLALHSGIAAALAFLALNVLQDLLGRRVGGPNAAATATMITVTLVCSIGASVAMSAVIGTTLSQRERAELVA